MQHRGMTGFGARVGRRALATGAALVVLTSSAAAQSPPATGLAPRIAADASPAADSSAASHIGAPAPSPVVTPRPPDAFTVLDARFRAEYLRARRESAVRSGPVIVVFDSEKLVLFRDRR